MKRRDALKSLLALGASPWSATGWGADPESGLIRVNIPGPHLLPFIPVELIPLLGIDRELGVELSGPLRCDDHARTKGREPVCDLVAFDSGG